jgi:hypothetical protein
MVFLCCVPQLNLSDTFSDLAPEIILQDAEIHVEVKTQEQLRKLILKGGYTININLKFRIVFRDVLPCKIIVDRRFRGTCCHHHPF